MSKNKYVSGQWIEKQCSRCKQIKPQTSFSKDRHHMSGYKSACKECASLDFQEWKKKDPEKVKRIYRKASYKKTYGLSDIEAQALVDNRIGICGICGNTKPLVVDHCHATNIVRGLICSHCNSMLGYSRDNIKNLQNAITYLEAFYG